ncbi:MAG: ferredoxin [spirochete symbiont of Stewartia floridana]|nr:MAG: ferredoxin [spirochete symbiont of Stewartia floridana]
MKLEFNVNGKRKTVETGPMRRLLDILRDDLGLTGSKEGCGEGECGACSVMLDGKLVNSCLIPARQCADADIFTIDGLKEMPAGRLMALSFAEAHSAQCGFCTPGMVMAAVALLKSDPDPSEAVIREGLSGNICRCTGYDMIIDGIQLAAKTAITESLKW